MFHDCFILLAALSAWRRFVLAKRRGGLIAVAALATALGSFSALPVRAQEATALESRGEAIDCLALAIAYEAGYEPVEGQRAVAEVVLNRVRSPGFPKTVCGVVYQGSTRRTGCQFTFTCDGALRRRLPDRIVAGARSVAEQAIDGAAAPLVEGATNYHAYYVSPRWAPALTRVTQIGAHIFYRRAGAAPVPGDTPLPPAPSPASGAVPAGPSAVFAPWGLAPPTGSTAALP